jgi:hypothetical protein
MIQSFKFSRLNSDVISHDINTEEGEYRMMENLVPAKSGRGMGRNRESLPGTTQIDNSLTGTHKVIGKFQDAPNNKLYYFVWEESGSPRKDKIYAYDVNTKTTEVIADSQYFGWTEDLKITGISVIDNVIYWTDYEMRYFRVQDNSQLIEINYYARAITTNQTYYFQAASVDGLVTVNVSVVVVGPLGISDVLDSIADQLNLNGTFSTYFTATKETDSEVVMITSKAKTGNWLLTNNSTSNYYFFSTNYDPVVENSADLSLYPSSPNIEPSFVAGYDAAINVNNIGGNNWQFAYRYVYTNNQISVFSPYSEIYSAAKFPEDRTSSGILNYLDILIPIYTDTEKFKSVELAARTSQLGDFSVVKVFERSELFKKNYPVIGNVLQYKFTGTEIQEAVPAADMIKQQEGQPLESIDLQFMKNKLFAIDNLSGFDVESGDFSMSVEVAEAVSLTVAKNNRWFKDGGRYVFGIRFFDDKMRTDGTIHKTTEINFNDEGYGIYGAEPGKDPRERKYVNITLAGKPPVWVHYYTFVRSEELFFAEFTQVWMYAHYWVRPMEEIETYADFSADTEYYAMWGQVYLRSDQNQNDLTKWRYIHLHTPTSMPFLVEKGDIVNVGANFPYSNFQSVIDIIGPMIVLERPEQLTAFATSGFGGWYEIFKPKTTTDTNSFYEVGGIKLVANPGLASRRFDILDPTPTFIIYGDCYFLDNKYGVDGTEDKRISWKYNFEYYTTSGSTEAEQGFPRAKRASGFFESISPAFRPTKTEVSEQIGVTVNNITGEILERSNISRNRYTYYDYDFGYVADPSYNNGNLGRPAPLLRNVRRVSRPSTLRWSNDYIENASINGLHTFEPLNEKSLPIERGPINKLQAAGEDVLLAIHSSAVTSMYIGKGIIRSADLNPTLITTDDVIGADNQLKYSYGTIHPESVCEVDGNVFFWDGRRNEPVRYAQNGLTPLATKYGTRVLFQDTIPSLFGSPDTYSCITEYDRLLNMVYWTFLKGSTKYTIGFHESSNSWIGTYSFAPELYGSVGDHLIGFVNGMPWLHNDNSAHQTFYGVLYASKLKVDVNIGEALEKAWDGLYIDSNVKWDVPMIYNEDGQSTNLIDDDFILKDNLQYADFLRDINTPAAKLKPGQIALRHGNPLSSHTLTLELEYTGYTPHYIRSMGVAATYKSGHLLKQQ